MSVRDELADAASTVQGITAHPYFQQATRPGHCFVRLDRISYPDKLGGVRRWNVVVILLQDQAGAEQYLEDKLPDLIAALKPVFQLVEAVPQRLEITGVGVLPCVFITGLREEE